MPGEPILPKTAREEIAKIGGAAGPGTDLWHNIARLYSAAIIQMNDPPFQSFDLTLPDADMIMRLPPMRRPGRPEIDEFFKISRFIINLAESPGADVMSDAACLIAQTFGRPLYNRLSYLVDTIAYEENPSIPPDLFRIRLNDLHYMLMLSHTLHNNDRRKYAGASFADRLFASMPDDGWDEKNQKLYPPLVRLLPCIMNDPDRHPNVYYLSKLNPQVDEALNSFAALGLAAIPMRCDIVFRINEIERTKKGRKIFRMKEPEDWPDRWEEELENRILECSANRIAIAALPELSGPPRVLEVVRKALAKCENNFPILFIAGSWHCDNKDSSFANRLTVLSSIDPDSVLFTHDKFEPFAEGEYKEGNVSGKRGLTFLVTSIGVIAFGICKDLFLERSSGDPIAHNQISGALPFLTVCPAMSGNLRDLINSASTLFKNVRSAMLTPNACGPAKNILRDGECCRTAGKNEGEKRMNDFRSFISAPKNSYNMSPFEHDKSIIVPKHGVYIARSSSCEREPGGHKTGKSHANTVSARIEALFFGE